MMTLECWFCAQPAKTIGYGFAVCGNGLCAGKARLKAENELTGKR